MTLKNLNVIFESDEFIWLKKVKKNAKLNWHDFLINAGKLMEAKTDG